MRRIVLVCFMCCIVVNGNLEARWALQSLKDTLLSRVNKTIPPYAGSDLTINLTLDYTPLAIVDLDSASEVLTVSSLFYVFWFDRILQWNPADFSGHADVELTPEDLWTPKIILTESIDNIQPLKTISNVVLYQTGFMIMTLNDVFRTRCVIDVSRYPFDVQRCKLTYVPSWGYNVSLSQKYTYVDTSIASTNGEWEMTGMESSVSNIHIGLDAAQYTLIIKRRHLYHVINIILPMSLLSVLNPVVFLIPAGSGEKLTFLMSIFVSHAMFLNLIHQSMPPTSDAVSTLAVFLVIIELQGFLTILATVFVLCVHQQILKANEKGGDSKNPDVVTVKTGRLFRLCCGGFPLDKVLDRLFFVISIGLSVASVSVWFIE